MTYSRDRRAAAENRTTARVSGIRAYIISTHEYHVGTYKTRVIYYIVDAYYFTYGGSTHDTVRHRRHEESFLHYLWYCYGLVIVVTHPKFGSIQIFCNFFFIWASFDSMGDTRAAHTP